MNHTASTPLTIVGGGLSGCILALSAMARGHQVRLMDRGNQQVASRAAAGVINPITGMRYSRSWRVDELLPVARSFYQKWEKVADKELWHPLPICRLFRSPELRDGFFKRRTLEQLAPYAARMVEPGEVVGPVENRYGGVWIDGGGWVDLSAFLDIAREQISSAGEWVEETASISELCRSSDGWVVDCRGYQPDPELWPELLWKPAHGDILTLESGSEHVGSILNRSQFILPLGPGRYRYGSTYQWDLQESEMREQGRSKLEQSLAEWVCLADIKVMDQQSGVRPILRDQKPALGRHRELANLAIFNGMGSKGGLWAPQLALDLLDHLDQGTELSAEISFKRFGVK